MRLSVIVIFTLFLTGWNSLVPSVSGFVPVTWLSWLLNGATLQFNRGTVTHGDMTKEALLQITRVIFLDNPNNENTGSTSRILSLQSIDESSLITAYYGRKEESITDKFESVIDAITKANANVDLGGEEEKLAEAHFDSEQFQAGQNRLVMLRQCAVSSIKMMNFGMARQDTGRMLHTLQDFYSHSNWLENGNADIYRILGRPDRRPQPVADADQETCSDCREDGTVIVGRIIELSTKILELIGLYDQIESAEKLYACTNNLRGYLSTRGVLTSGYYTGNHHFGGQLITKPRGKCSHGGFLDSTSDLSAKGGINKDSQNKKWSPHHYHHSTAAEMAEEATVDILQEMRKDINNDSLFAEFLGISVNTVSASIAYVIDTTGSMGEELPEIQATIPQIRVNLQAYAETNGITNIRYILVPFNDPGAVYICVINGTCPHVYVWCVCMCMYVHVS